MIYLKTLHPIFFLLVSCILSISSCADTPTKNTSTKKAASTTIATPPLILQAPINMHPSMDSITDARDGATYATVTIGKQTWMAENLRYETKGSMLNPDNPSKSYGRLYEIIAAQTACPKGWHLPTDAEWDEVEMAHGMPATFIGKGGWRGEHASHLRSVSGWDEDGTNSLGFNVLPAGYYFSEKTQDMAGLDGLGFSAAFWSARKDEVGFARFMFGVRKFVNKWEDTKNDSGARLSCRCVRD